MTSTSLSLLDRARNERESDAWERLVKIYSPLMRRWISRFGLQDSDAEDLVQEVLLTVANELQAFEHSGRVGAFRKWLRLILANRLQHYWRARGNRPMPKGGSSLPDQLRELEDGASNLSQIWNDEHDRHVLKRLATQIRPRFQQKTWEAFRRQIQGESADAVAESLEMPVHSVYVAKSRVLSALRHEAAGLVEDGEAEGIDAETPPNLK